MSQMERSLDSLSPCPHDMANQNSHHDTFQAGTSDGSPNERSYSQVMRRILLHNGDERCVICLSRTAQDTLTCRCVVTQKLLTDGSWQSILGVCRLPEWVVQSLEKALTSLSSMTP